MAKPKKYRLTITAVVSVEEIEPRKDQTRPVVEELTTRPAWFPEETTRRRKPKGEKRQTRDNGRATR